MGDIGKITPAFEDGEEVKQWRIPIQVFLLPTTRELVVESIYEDEGFLCIDVKEKEAENA